MSAQEAIVALAGPVMNLIIAIVLTIILFAINAFASTFVFTTVGMLICLTLQMAISVNIGLGVFNLIPLPPLDGSKILMHFLPYNAKTWFENNTTAVLYYIYCVMDNKFNKLYNKSSNRCSIKWNLCYGIGSIWNFLVIR